MNTRIWTKDSESVSRSTSYKVLSVELVTMPRIVPFENISAAYPNFVEELPSNLFMRLVAFLLKNFDINKS